MKELEGRVAVLTKMRNLPDCCQKCRYYDSMGGRGGMYNNGACTAEGSYRSTEHICVTKQRLKSCPLRIVGGEQIER